MGKKKGVDKEVLTVPKPSKEFNEAYKETSSLDVESLKKEMNEFYTTLHERDLGLKRVSENPFHNVYEKV